MPNKKNQKSELRGQKQTAGQDDFHCRAVAFRPASFNEATRSFEADFATENPVWSWNMSTWQSELDVLLMSGCQMPESGQIPLLDTHSRYDTSSLIGSGRDLAVAGDILTGRIHFSSVPAAEDPYTKCREGHLTDVSLGYKPLEIVKIPDGQTGVVDGRTFDGPLNVITRWQPREISVCVIGADEAAKIRSALAPGKPIIHKEDKTMDEKLRALLEARGLPKTATEEEAWAFAEKLEVRSDPPPPPPSPPQASAPSDDTIRAAISAERVRVAEISQMGEILGFDELARTLVTEGKTIEQARTVFLEKLSERAAAAKRPDYRGTLIMGADERDKFRDATIDSLILRTGHEALRLSCKAVFEKPAPGATDLMGFSLRELAREALRIAGQPMTGRPIDMVGRALTTSDFPLILAAVANKSLFAGWETAEETWTVWCATGPVSDFKTHTSVRASEYSDLEEVPEDTEYKYGKRTEAQETYSIATYGKLFAISRQTIINDDLGALTNVPAGHGQAAARKVGDIAYAVLTGNAVMGDGLALFEASVHKNYVAHGTGAVPGVNTIGAGILAMKTQKDLQGLRRLNIRPNFLIAPAKLEAAAEIFFNTMQWSDRAVAATPDHSDSSTRTNPYAGSYFTRVYEPRLDDSTDVDAWYLAGPKSKTVTVFFLDGIQTPYMETKQGWNVDGVEYKVRIDAGAKAMDYRGLYQNHGH